MSLADACRQHGVDVQAVSSELAHLARTPEETAPEDPDALIALIVSRHHAYVRDAIPSIQSHLAKVIAAHGRSHPEVIRIASHFDVIAEELTLHLAKEERVLFPYIHSLAVATQNGGPPPPDVFGTVQNPIRMMETEHQNAGDELAAIRSLTSDYKAPADACATYRLVYAELQAFERVGDARFGGTDGPGELVERTRFSIEGGHAAATRLLVRGVTAIICASDPLALGAVRAARRAGLGVPEDLSVVGYDDSALMACTDPPLTTVRQPIEAIGRAAVEMLVGQIEGSSVAPEELFFEPEIVARGSTASAPSRAALAQV